MNIRHTIRRILREELYSPAGKEYKPSKVVVHKSNPVWRDNIKLTGLQTSVGDCYQQYVGGDIECKESIFATDSLIEKDMFDSTYDDDIWLIDTECAGVTWYKDRHFDNGDYEHHIVTFEDISPDCLKLIYKGSGKSEDFIQESIRKVLREEVNRRLLNNIIRRLNNIDELIQQSTEWTFLFYKEKLLKDKGVDWFIVTVIDGFYIDYISPIFEDWEDNLPVMSITDDEEDEIRTFFETLYYDKIAEYYEDNIGNNLQENIRKVLREESESRQISPFIRRRWDLIKKIERESFDYLLNIFEEHVSENIIKNEKSFTNLYCTVIMDGLYPHLSNLEQESFDYDRTFDEIKTHFKEQIHEFWKYVNKKYGTKGNKKILPVKTLSDLRVESYIRRYL